MIECGTQATGGNYSFFTEVPGMTRVGFPWAEVAEDGSTVIGKHDGTGGEVSVGTVTSQLLYEIGGPEYFGPDVTTRFDTIELEQVGPDRVRMHGIQGEPPPATLKVCINRPGGFRNDINVCLTGLDIEAKAKLIEEAFWQYCPLEPKDFASVTTRLMRTDQPDPATNEAGRGHPEDQREGPGPEQGGPRLLQRHDRAGPGQHPGLLRRRRRPRPRADPSACTSRRRSPRRTCLRRWSCWAARPGRSRR